METTFDARTAIGIAGIEIGVDGYRVHLRDGNVIPVEKNGNVLEGQG